MEICKTMALGASLLCSLSEPANAAIINLRCTGSSYFSSSKDGDELTFDMQVNDVTGDMSGMQIYMVGGCSAGMDKKPAKIRTLANNDYFEMECENYQIKTSATLNRYSGEFRSFNIWKGIQSYHEIKASCRFLKDRKF